MSSMMNAEELAIGLIERNLVARDMPPSGAKDFWLIGKAHGLHVDELLEWIGETPWPISLSEIPTK